MTHAAITESVVEEAALGWEAGLGYTVLSGPSIAPGELVAEGASYEEPVLARRLDGAIDRLNPDAPAGEPQEGGRCVRPRGAIWNS